MKFEVKTQNDDRSKSFLSSFYVFSLISLIIILSNISYKLGTISRHYEINYLCKLLSIENSALNLKKLSKSFINKFLALINALANSKLFSGLTRNFLSLIKHSTSPTSVEIFKIPFAIVSPITFGKDSPKLERT